MILDNKTPLLLEWTSLDIKFQGQSLFKPFNGQIRQGQKIAILGCNGSGKSSLMKALLGLLETEGSSKINWHLNNKKLSYVPQSFDFDFQVPLTVQEFFDISMIQKIWTWPWTQSKIETTQNISWGEEGLLNKRLHELSRGQIQKMIIARAYLKKPTCVFLDEPLTGLDKTNRHHLQRQIFAQTETLVMIIHDHDWMDFGFTHVLELGTEAQPQIQTIDDYRKQNTEACKHV